MRLSLRILTRFASLALVALLAIACARTAGSGTGTATVIRVATFNIQELSTEKIMNGDEQALAAAELIKTVRPQLLLLNEIDTEMRTGDHAANARLFNERLLDSGDNAIRYPYIYSAATNTGLLSHHDLNNDGVTATEADEGKREHGDDSFGYGIYPGQYGMAVLSTFPIDEAGVRTFQNFLWKDLPGHHMPKGWFNAEEERVVRLSSKSHWDVPIEVNGETIHFLVSHPTPPAFDGDEDRNGRRNHDEIKFWARYLDDDPALYDDRGRTGGLKESALFIIAGDLNASPDAEPVYDNTTAIGQLLQHPRVRETLPYTMGAGAPEGRPAATAQFLGGKRVDYVLPCRALKLVGGEVVWPDPREDAAKSELAEKASDHRMVWIEVEIE